MRGARDLGIPTVAVHSDVDADLPHVRLADEAYCLGPAPAAESYLNIERLLAVAERAGADAVHPGYGFLSENAGFVRACTAAGLTFVGPPAEAMDQMGDKIASRRSMQAAGVPIVPGTIDPVTSVAEAEAAAEAAGYPVIVKASAGGGGKGIRVVRSRGELARAISNAQEEAGAAFGDGAVFVEKLLRPARHIEVQVDRRRRGQRRHAGRARVLAAAAAPEADRGIAVGGGEPRPARPPGSGRRHRRAGPAAIATPARWSFSSTARTRTKSRSSRSTPACRWSTR